MKRITSVLNVETDRVDNTVGTGGWGISVGAAQDLMALRRDWEQKTQELLMLLGK
jgi:hypothetical protein